MASPPRPRNAIGAAGEKQFLLAPDATGGDEDFSKYGDIGRGWIL